MGHPASARYRAPRGYPKRSAWRVPSENRLRIVPRPESASGDWGEPIGAEPQCEARSTEISEGYKAAIALLRSWRDASEEDAQEQRETWDLLKQALDEDRYH